jgi:hypothetical protein
VGSWSSLNELEEGFYYDWCGRIIEQSLHNPSHMLFLRGYKYVLEGNLIELADSKKGRSRFAYDPVERLREMTQPEKKVERFVYDRTGFSEDYKGVLVKFQLEEGTTNALREIGVRAHGAKSSRLFPDLPEVKKRWGMSKALFKPERDQINIGLGKGQAIDIFNDRLRGFEVLGVNR